MCVCLLHIALFQTVWGSRTQTSDNNARYANCCCNNPAGRLCPVDVFARISVFVCKTWCCFLNWGWWEGGRGGSIRRDMSLSYGHSLERSAPWRCFRSMHASTVSFKGTQSMSGSICHPIKTDLNCNLLLEEDCGWGTYGFALKSVPQNPAL